MNLGLLKGWAAGGPAGLTAVPAGAATPVPSPVEGAADPAFRTLMDLFAVPAPVFALRDSDAMASVAAPVLAWPSAPTRATVKDIEALTIAPALESTDDDEQTVDQLLAGLLACTELKPVDRACPRPDAPAVALSILPVRDESDEIAETPAPAATPFVRQAPVVMPPERSFEPPRAARIGKTVRAAEQSEAAVHVDVSGIATGAVAPADALVSHDRDQPEPESEPLKQAPAMPAKAAAGRTNDTDRNAAMPEFATPAGRPAVNMPGGDAQAPFKAPLKAPAASITFTASFTHAVHAMAAGRMQAAASIHAPHAPASLPATTAAQIVQTIQLAWFRHGGEARITLDPEQFGDLSVAMRVDRGVVVARLQADAPQVREWLHANADTLRAGLAEHHLRLDHLEIAATDDARESENSEAGQRHGNHPSSHPRRSRRHRPDQQFEIDA
jgi:hypothetical protein